MSDVLEEILREIERLRREVDALRCLDQPTLTGHTHTQAESHYSPDTNGSAAALHHTLGTGAYQAAAGNHSHTLSALGGNLTQARSHDSPDTNGSAAALHHTLGTGAYQASAGNHTHSGFGFMPFTAYAVLPASIAADNYPYACAVQRTWTFSAWAQPVYVATTNNVSNYWTLKLIKRDLVTVIATVNTSGIAAATHALLTTSSFNPGSVGTSDIAIYVQVIKVGSPGNLTLSGIGVLGYY